MSNRIHALAQQLTGKQYLEDCSLEEVKQIAQRYPYFAPAQFLLLQKFRQSGTAEEADDQYKKVVLFYPDPLQFEFFIAAARFYQDAAEVTQNDVNAFAAIDADQVNAAIEDEPTEATTETASFVGNKEAQDIYAVPLFDASEELIGDDVQKETAKPEENIANATHQDIVVAEDVQEPLATVTETESIQPISEEVKEWPQATSPLTFEPYHTVDYFASQGIKISGEELPKDKLGKQLKSFTEWLKTMKRLPATQPAGSSETPAEKGVEMLADHSVSDSEVVTEAMAEVWVKQGAPQKALDIYNKLLLHDPSKKAYFAAKIENLKQS